VITTKTPTDPERPAPPAATDARETAPKDSGDSTLLDGAAPGVPDVSFEEITELIETTYALAKRLLPFMAKRRIPLTPYNYRLFFDYLTSDDQTLKDKLDEVLRSRKVMTPELSEKLYHEFYDYLGDKGVSLTQVGNRIGSVSKQLTKNLEKTLDSTGHYRQLLSDTAQQMSQGEIGDDNVKELLASLILETKYALNTQSDLADHIESTNKIIATLTSELRDQTRLASVDELTQLFNRRYLLASFKQHAEDGGEDPVLSIALYDLDRFKVVNDTHGHAIGDKVLILCAKILQGHADSSVQLPCRYGGEEFLVLYPNGTLKEAAEYAESVRLQVERTKVMVRGEAIPVTLSCGVAQFRKGEDFLALVERADQALYKAKGSGRNKVMTENDLNQ
jgi:diguanylate cyclase